MKGLTEGRIVHYVLPDGKSQGAHRPAIVVRVWRQHEPCLVQLLVFVDGTNDYMTSDGLAQWRTSVHHDPDGKPGTWHWIEPA